MENTEKFHQTKLIASASRDYLRNLLSCLLNSLNLIKLLMMITFNVLFISPESKNKL